MIRSRSSRVEYERSYRWLIRRSYRPEILDLLSSISLIKLRDSFRDGVFIKCEICGTEVFTITSKIKKRRTCSKKCQDDLKPRERSGKYLKGRKNNAGEYSSIE